MMPLLRSLAYNAFYIAWTCALMVLFLPAMLLPDRILWPFIRFWIRGLVHALRLTCGIRFEVRGQEHIPHGPAIIASKHQSALDIFLLALILPRPAFIMKKTLLYIPLFGLYLLRAGNIAIDRKTGARALRRMLEHSRRALAQGRPLVIFPEGTRTLPGVRAPYPPGVAALYNQLALPVVPVALNTGCFWPRNAFVKRPGTAIIEFLPPLPPGQYKGRAFLGELEERIELAGARLTADG